MIYLEFSLVPLLLLVLLSLSFIQRIRKKRSDGTRKKLPPGPWKLPIIGNMHHLMGYLPHHALRNLAQKHGDLMHLQLGEISAIVASSASTAREILKTHDLAFADRPEFQLVPRIIFYDCSSVAFSPHGEYWRQMRKICTMELLNGKSVRSFAPIRADEALRLISSIREASLLQSKEPIDLTPRIFTYNNSIVCRAAFGRVSGQHQGKVMNLIKEVVARTSGFDVSDLFPSWKLVHHLSLMKPKLLELHNQLDEILDIIIQQHVESPTERNGEFGQEDMIDVLRRIKQSGQLHSPITDKNMKAVLMDLFFGGTETSTTTVDWAMAEMIRNPNVLAKAQSEIRESLKSKGKETIDENDIKSLSYLSSIIKETLRLHTPGPLLLPRSNREQCQIDGYIIPPKARVMINAWAIGRDPRYWDDPESFIPERFENTSVDFTGNNFEFLPFGGGRRICPGISFGLASVEVLLANLLYHFDWKLPNDVDGASLDMTEAYGITAPRKNNLVLVASVHH